MAELTKLNNLILPRDEEEYDKIASDSVLQLQKVTDLDGSNLNDLDAATQTILYLFVLCAQIDISLKSGKAPSKQLPLSILPEGRLWPNITQILLNFDPIQVRYSGSQLRKVIDVVIRGAEQTGEYVPAIQLLEIAIFRLDPQSSTLTTTHYAYVRLCLLAKAFEVAITVLDKPIYNVPSSEVTKQVGDRAYKYLCSAHESSSSYITVASKLTHQINSRIYMEYFLLGAVCCMGAGQYEKALVFLEMVLTTPTSQSALSLIQLEAFKKWYLVNLLVHGSPGKFPKSIAQPTLRHLRAAAKPYECVVDAFKSGKAERLRGEIQEGMGVWNEDENYGLIHEVFGVFRKYAILGLAKTYAALPIEQVTQLTSPEPKDHQETVHYLIALIQAGQLQAELIPGQNGRLGTLRFASEQTIPLPEAVVEQEMLSRTQNLQHLLQNISDLDHQMEIHKDYIEFLQKHRNARDRTKKSDAAANRGVGIDIHDEDMMEDI